MNGIAFGSWWPLWLLALVPLLWWASKRSRVNLSAKHVGVATALRTLALVAAVGALMQPVWTASMTQVSVVYAIDVSRSVASGFVQSALQFIHRANREGTPARARYVVFADRARMVEQPADIAKVAVSGSLADRGRLLYQGATNLELALDEAMLGLDPNRIRRVVLFSDGNATAGDVWRAVPRLANQGVRVYAFAATPRVQADAWVESLALPRPVRRDEPTVMTVRVVSQQPAKGRLVVTAQGARLAARSVTLEAGANPLAVEVRLRKAGPVTVAAEIQAEGDELRDNDRLEQSVWVDQRPRVLYVEGQPDAAQYLRDALSREGLDVVTAAPADLPASGAVLEAFDAVILSDVGPDALDVRRMQALRSYVQDRGGGLLFAAGENTYGESGFSDSVLEQVLPAEFKSQEKRKDLAVILCLDRSYSMKGRPIALAKAGARAALDMLEEQHWFGVVAFDSQPHEAVPLQYVRSKRRAEDLIDRIQASGQTNIYPALATAWRLLQNHSAGRKHVLLLSDGDTAPADFERLLKRMTDAKITVSTIMIGRNGDPELMKRIAEWGHGKAYVAANLEDVPQFFVEDTRNVSRASLLEEPFRPVVKRKIAAVRGLNFAQAPQLLGFASAKAKDGAEVFLATEQGAPILARWQYGLGRAVLFASDVKNRWAANWLKWDGYGKFWSQLVRDTLRRDTGEQAVLRVEREGEQAQLSLALMSERGEWRNGLAPLLQVRRPDGAIGEIALAQSGPGQYRASMDIATAGSRPYTFELLAQGGVGRQTARRAGTQQLFYPYPDEYRSYPPDIELLRAIAEQTGGKLAPSVQEIFAAHGDRGVVRRPLWPWLAAAALLLYLVDLAVRRAPWVRRWLD